MSPELIFPMSVADFPKVGGSFCTEVVCLSRTGSKAGELEKRYQTLKPSQTREKNIGIHPIPHHQFFSIVALCKCSTAAVNLSTCLVRLANDWRTMQRNIASSPEADCAANHFLQPTDSRGRLMSNNLILDIRSAHQEQFPPHIIDAY